MIITINGRQKNHQVIYKSSFSTKTSSSILLCELLHDGWKHLHNSVQAILFLRQLQFLDHPVRHPHFTRLMTDTGAGDIEPRT